PHAHGLPKGHSRRRCYRTPPRQHLEYGRGFGVMPTFGLVKCGKAGLLPPYSPGKLRCGGPSAATCPFGLLPWKRGEDERCAATSRDVGRRPAHAPSGLVTRRRRV